MAEGALKRLTELLQQHHKNILDQWIDLQTASVTGRRDLIKDTELREQSRRFLDTFSKAVASGHHEISGEQWANVRAFLADLSKSGAHLGFSPSETATFVFSLKEPLFSRLRQALQSDPEALAEQIWTTSVLLDKLGLLTTEMFQKTRDDVITRQQHQREEAVLSKENRSFQVTVDPAKSGNGETVGTVAVLSDITEQTQHEQALRENDAEIRKLNGELRERIEAYQRVVRDLQASQASLEGKVTELEQFEEVVVGRELKMIALEKELLAVRKELEALKAQHQC